MPDIPSLATRRRAVMRTASIRAPSLLSEMFQPALAAASCPMFGPKQADELRTAGLSPVQWMIPARGRRADESMAGANVVS